MPEVKWVDADNVFDAIPQWELERADCYIPVFTLDQLEAWILAEEGKWSRDREEVFIDLLAQVQAWKEKT